MLVGSGQAVCVARWLINSGMKRCASLSLVLKVLWAAGCNSLRNIAPSFKSLKRRPGAAKRQGTRFGNCLDESFTGKESSIVIRRLDA